jgi:hypothetical protein
MKKIFILLSAVLAASPLFADTIELADGSLLEGDFIGSSNGIIMFNSGGDIQAFPESEVIGIFLSEGVATAQANTTARPASGITVPAGTRLVIRMSDTVDSNQHGAGHRFRAQLEGAIVVDGITVLPRGAIIQGRVASAQQAGRAVGSSNMSIEFTDVMLDDVLHPIATGDISTQTANEGGRTLRRTARAAAIGGLIDGSSGARTGAKVGAGAAILTGGASINIPRGTIVETALRAALVVPIPQ